MANTETKVDLVINRMSQSKYEQLKSAGQLNPNQIYMTTDGTDPVPETRKVNGQTLEADVTLTGADIAVSASDSTKINTALAGKQTTLSAQQLANIAAVPNKANDSDVVHNTGAETIAGVKTFSNGIVMANDIMLDYYALKFGGTNEVFAAIGNNSDEVFFWNNDNIAMLKVGNGGTIAFTAATGHAGEIATLDANGNPVASGYDTSDFLTSVPTSYKTYADTLTQLGADGFKTYDTTKLQLGADGFMTFADTKTALDSIYKPLQTAKTDPTASGNATSFIDTITQDVNGVITATKKSVNFSGYKPTQTAKSSPTASGSTTSFIDTISQDANGVITATKKNVSFSGYKPTQTAVSDPTASGTATSFIDTISQNANGVITATKKSLPTASTSAAGIVQLNNTRTSTSTTVAPTANALKLAYDNCIHTSGTNQVINDCTTFRFDGTADWTVGDSAAHTINNIELRDVNDYLAGYLQTQRTASNNYVTNLVCRAPTGTSGAASSAAITIYITPSNGKYVGFPTPGAGSNSAIGATTEWVNSRIDESWKRVTVGSSGVLENHAINVLTMTGIHKLYPPASLANSGNRHFYLLATNTSAGDRTLKFYRYESGGAASTITYYMDDGITPVTSISSASYFYEFYETSQNMFYVKQTKIVDKSSVIGTNS